MKLLAFDDSRLRQMGRSGFERVQRFTWERFVSDLDDALDAMVTEAKR